MRVTYQTGDRRGNDDQARNAQGVTHHDHILNLPVTLWTTVLDVYSDCCGDNQPDHAIVFIRAMQTTIPVLTAQGAIVEQLELEDGSSFDSLLGPPDAGVCFPSQARRHTSGLSVTFSHPHFPRLLQDLTNPEFARYHPHPQRRRLLQQLASHLDNIRDGLGIELEPWDEATG